MGSPYRSLGPGLVQTHDGGKDLFEPKIKHGLGVHVFTLYLWVILFLPDPFALDTRYGFSLNLFRHHEVLYMRIRSQWSQYR